MEAISNDRVRAYSPDKINQTIDEETAAQIRNLSLSDKALISKRIDELEREWDVERALETTASSLSITGLLLGAFVDRKWFFLPGVVTAFLLQHSVQGWCPPLAVFRALKFRTQKEIDREKFALKALRGDMDKLAANKDLNEILEAFAGKPA